jgi:hypothetical protein
MTTEARQIGEATDAWSDLGPTQRSSLSEQPQQPSARIVGIMGKLGLRYPPASSVDREAHAARVALLAEDCADIPADWLDEAARSWAKEEPFMPRACELRESALRIGRFKTRHHRLPPPVVQEEVKPPAPPLTDDEIRVLPQSLIDMGVKLGEIDPVRAANLRDEAA